MPQVKNKRKSKFAKLDRELMRDKRLKSNHKLLYALLCSLSESCENVFPSYEWLAEEIGYETEGKSENALYMFITRNLEPLIELGLVTAEKNDQGTQDYCVNDYDPTHKNVSESHKNVSESHKNVSNYSQKCEPYIIGEERIEIKEGEKKTAPEKTYEELPAPIIPTPKPDYSKLEAITESLEQRGIDETVATNIIAEMIQKLGTDAPKIKKCIAYLDQNEKRWLEPLQLRWLGKNIEAFKKWGNAKQITQTTEDSSVINAPPLYLPQREGETIEEYEARCAEREAEGRRVNREYLPEPKDQTPTQTIDFKALKAQFLNKTKMQV